MNALSCKPPHTPSVRPLSPQPVKRSWAQDHFAPDLARDIDLGFMTAREPEEVDIGVARAQSLELGVWFFICTHAPPADVSLGLRVWGL